MSTKTFSGRAEVDKLAYADALAQREYGMSYGQFCSSVLIDYIYGQKSLPAISIQTDEQDRRLQALKRLREMSERLRASNLATMTDEEMKQQIASRYA